MHLSTHALTGKKINWHTQILNRQVQMTETGALLNNSHINITHERVVCERTFPYT